MSLWAHFKSGEITFSFILSVLIGIRLASVFACIGKRKCRNKLECSGFFFVFASSNKNVLN